MAKEFFYGVPLKCNVTSSVIFKFSARNEKKALWEYQVTNDA